MGRCSGASIQVRAMPGRTRATVFPESFKDFPIKSLIDSLSWWHKFLVDDPLTVKITNEHDLILDLPILAFLGRGDFAVCHSRLWRFV